MHEDLTNELEETSKVAIKVSKQGMNSANTTNTKIANVNIKENEIRKKHNIAYLKDKNDKLLAR